MEKDAFDALDFILLCVLIFSVTLDVVSVVFSPARWLSMAVTILLALEKISIVASKLAEIPSIVCIGHKQMEYSACRNLQADSSEPFRLSLLESQIMSMSLHTDERLSTCVH